MFKTGIWRRDQADAYLGQHTTPKGDLPDYFSYRILKLPQPPSPADVSIFENAMRGLRLPNGIYRTTYRGRMAELDEISCRILRSNFPGSMQLQAEDWAASDCLTASEFAAVLWRHFPQAVLTASDLHFHMIEAVHNWQGAFVFEESGQPLQYILPPFVISFSRVTSPLYLLNRILLAVSRRMAEKAWKAAAAVVWKDLLDDQVFDIDGWRIQRIPLIHPEALALARATPLFRFHRHSVFDWVPEPVEFIRTMNILNRSYFSNADLTRGSLAVHKSLREGGIWVIGRTLEEVSPPEHHASIWRKHHGRLQLLERIGKGAEIDDLIGGIAES